MWTGQLQSTGFCVRGDGLNEDVWLMSPQLPQDRGLEKGQFRGWKAHGDNRTECKDQRHSSPCPPPPTSTCHIPQAPRATSTTAWIPLSRVPCLSHEVLHTRATGWPSASHFNPGASVSYHLKKVPISQIHVLQIRVPIPHMAGHM